MEIIIILTIIIATIKFFVDRINEHNNSTIYIYRLKDKRRTFYVGQTVNPNSRLASHRRDANYYGTAKQQKIAEMHDKGRDIKMEIITKANSKKKADELERKYIRKWGTHNTLLR